jgi:hypothetical protein
MSIVRSTAAVGLGLACAGACLSATAVGLESTLSPKPFGAADMFLTGFRWLLGSLLGGYVTAAVVHRAPLKHCVVLGAIFIVIIAYLVGWGSLDFFPPVYIDSMLLVILAAAVMGGYIRSVTTKTKTGFGHDGT